MKSGFILISLALLLAGCANSDNLALTTMLNKSQAAGRYNGEILLRSLPGGRNMEVAKAFEYVDPNNVRWGVPEKTEINGASIPKYLWSVVGSPFTGLYRDASVVHDFFCETRVRPAKQVHRVFYDAMITSGVSKSKANVMYYAVIQFGPKWKSVSRRNICEGKYKPESMGLTEEEKKICKFRTRTIGPDPSIPVRTKFNRKDFEAARKIIEAGSFSAGDIEKLASQRRG